MWIRVEIFVYYYVSVSVQPDLIYIHNFECKRGLVICKLINQLFEDF